MPATRVRPTRRGYPTFGKASRINYHQDQRGKAIEERQSGDLNIVSDRSTPAGCHLNKVTKEEELKLQHDRKKFDIWEEYFRLSAKPEEDWDMKRVPRPKGTPEWGVLPPKKEPSTANVQ
ncbi:hypothetical protein C8J57DRAFT_1250050 [Mycena rebaudengoi]|nr:hypothetical protein C8J57DRAFT_1250050 [Mycena rebaudengoi]